MASDREKKVTPGKTGRFGARLGGGGARGAARAGGGNGAAEESDDEKRDEPEREDEGAPEPSESGEDAPEVKSKSSGALPVVPKGKKKRKKQDTEAQAIELEPITEFPRGLSIGVKFAATSAVVVAFFMSFLGWLTYSITLHEVDELITQKGVSAAEALEKALDRAFWIEPPDVFEGLVNAALIDKDGKNNRPVINAVWSARKKALSDELSKNLTSLVENSNGQILAAAVIEGESSAVALSAKQVKLGNAKPFATIGPKDSPDRVEVWEAVLEGQRVRQFDKPISRTVVGDDGKPRLEHVRGSAGPARVSLFVNAAKIDDVRDTVWQRIALVTLVGAAAGILLTVLIAAVLSRPIRELEKDIAVVAEGDLDHETSPSSRDEIGALAHTFNIMTRNLKAAQANAANQKALERELTIATEIQTKLLPERIPQIPGLDIHSFYLSAKEVGGDYYDFIVIDQTHLGIIVADVSGKGIPGSMVMTMARSLVRLASVRNVSPADTFKKVNRILAKDIRRGMFVTSIYMVLNVKTHELRVASAGHNPLVVFRAATGEVELVKPQGIALGFDKGTIFDNHIQEVEIKLAQGDRIVAYTDGVNEAMDAQSEEFGDERFHEIVKRHARLPSKDFVGKIVEALEEHRGGAEQSDDITITTLAVVK